MQRAYYDAIALTFHNDTIGISAASYMKQMNEIFEVYNNFNDNNFATFLVQSSQHCYTNFAAFYTADTTGVNGSGGETFLKMRDWIFELEQGGVGNEVKNECKGKEQDDLPDEVSIISGERAEQGTVVEGGKGGGGRVSPPPQPKKSPHFKKS